MQYKIYLKFITLGGSKKTLQSLFYSINFSNLQQYVFMLYLKVNLPYPVIDNSVFYLILSWCCVKLFYAVSYIGPWFGLIEMNLAYFLKSKSYSRIIFEPLALQEKFTKICPIGFEEETAPSHFWKFLQYFCKGLKNNSGQFSID